MNWGELEKIASYSDIYSRALTRWPEDREWIEGFPANPLTETRLEVEWERLLAAIGDSEEAWLRALQRFRRRTSLLIAHRVVSKKVEDTQTLADISALADFVIGQLFARIYQRTVAQFGEPWDEALERPARFAILGLGKLGGSELNFCSDVDLVYVYDGDGRTVKNGRRTNLSNSEFYIRVCRDFSSSLAKRLAEGFLYNIDLRLRPEGDSGPLVRSLTAMEHYYYVRGQTWERMAWIKARRITGDEGLVEELFETINPFRFPRHPPPALLERVAGVKARIEREVLSPELLERDIKNGRGGIREIEFFVQTLQMLNGGRLPFVRSSNTLTAIAELTRYGILDRSTAAGLRKRYLRFRRVENVLQMRAEEGVYALPEGEALRGQVADLSGYGDLETMDREIAEARDWVNAIYRETFTLSESEARAQAWTRFFAEGEVDTDIETTLSRWGLADRGREGLRLLVLGDLRNVVTRDAVDLFLEIAEVFDDLMPRLARVEDVLERINQFGAAFHARKEFLKALSSNPNAFRSIALLFDRSRFSFALLSRHPEIFEEVMMQGLRRDKGVETLRQELRAAPEEEAEAQAWHWLYIKAEQTRIAIREALDEVSAAEARDRLTRLADAMLLEWLARSGAQSEIALVALGKYAAREITFGSDLDLVALAREGQAEPATRLVRNLQKWMRYTRPPRMTWEVDLRLRPHGDDGPLASSTSALARYFDGGGAQFWERMAYSRARVIGGAPELAEGFEALRQDRVLGAPVTAEDLASIGEMRRRIENEKAPDSREGIHLKAGRGGLVDIEFLCQRYLLTHSEGFDGVVPLSASRLLSRLAEMSILPQADAERLREDYEFLRGLEQAARRFDNEGVSVLNQDLAQLLAVWDNYPNPGSLMDQTRLVMDRVRGLTKRWIEVPGFPE